MTSPSFESVVADANVLLSAGIRRAALRVFVFSKLKVFTTEDLMVDETTLYPTLENLASCWTVARARERSSSRPTDR